VSKIRLATVVFVCVCAYLAWIAASRIFLGDNDEGILFDAARRILSGQIPYRDFFAWSGPASSFLIAASWRILGISLASARATVIFDVAAMTTCVFWLTERLAGTFCALITALAFVGFEMLNLGLFANHRWDSAAWMTVAVTLVYSGLEGSGRKRLAACCAAGIAATLAVLCTPPVAIAGAALGVCLLFAQDRFRAAAAYVAGIIIASGSTALYFASRGALVSMVRSAAWAGNNYGIANHTYYGWISGGYFHLFAGATVVGASMTGILLVFITLPATLPLIATMWLWKRPDLKVIAIFACGVALIFSAYPRWDLIHLNYIAAPFYVLAAALIANSRFRKPVAGVATIVAVCVLEMVGQRRLSEPSRVTTVGTVHGSPADLQAVSMLLDHVRPQETLFMFPYRPIVYFLTLTRNPTRYAFLQPGMFPASDAKHALDELTAQPPRWIVYMDIPDSEYLRLWPGSDPSRMRMPGIEAFIRERYRKIDQTADFQLLEYSCLHCFVKPL